MKATPIGFVLLTSQASALVAGGTVRSATDDRPVTDTRVQRELQLSQTLYATTTAADGSYRNGRD